VEFFQRPQNTATIAVWAEQNRLVKPLRSRQPGDLVIYDRYGAPKHSTGPRGHIGMVSEDVNVTWEAASSRGVQRYSYSRLGWVWCVDMGGWLRRGAGPGSSGGGIPDPIEEDDLTPEQDKLLREAHQGLAEIRALLGDASKPGVLRDLSAQLGDRPKPGTVGGWVGDLWNANFNPANAPGKPKGGLLARMADTIAAKLK
jgi:hypothetical protein